MSQAPDVSAQFLVRNLLLVCSVYGIGRGKEEDVKGGDNKGASKDGTRILAMPKTLDTTQ